MLKVLRRLPPRDEFAGHLLECRWPVLFYYFVQNRITHSFISHHSFTPCGYGIGPYQYWQQLQSRSASAICQSVPPSDLGTLGTGILQPSHHPGHVGLSCHFGSSVITHPPV